MASFERDLTVQGYDCSFTPLLMSHPTKIFPLSIKLVINSWSRRVRAVQEQVKRLDLRTTLDLRLLGNRSIRESYWSRKYRLAVLHSSSVVSWQAGNPFVEMPHVADIDIGRVPRGHILHISRDARLFLGAIAEMFDGPYATPVIADAERKLTKSDYEGHVEEHVETS